MWVQQLNDILVNAHHKTLGPGCPQEIVKANNHLTFALTVYRSALLPLMKGLYDIGEKDRFNGPLPGSDQFSTFDWKFRDYETRFKEATKFFLSVSIFENHKDPIAPE